MYEEGFQSFSAGVLIFFKIFCRAPRPVPYLSHTRPIPVPYPSHTRLASLGLIKGRGQTLYLISATTTTHNHPPENFLEAVTVP